MSLLTSIAGGILRPEEIGEPPVRIVEKASVAMQVSQLVCHNHVSRFLNPGHRQMPPQPGPLAVQITPSDAGATEITVTPKKRAALSIISNDSSPAAANVVGDSIARDLAH